MYRPTLSDRITAEGQMVAVPRPSPAEGVGRALQAAFRDLPALPIALQTCLERLDRLRF